MLTMKLKYSMFRSWRMHVVLGLAMSQLVRSSECSHYWADVGRLSPEWPDVGPCYLPHGHCRRIHDTGRTTYTVPQRAGRRGRRPTGRHSYSFIIINCQNAIEHEVTIDDNKIYNVDSTWVLTYYKMFTCGKSWMLRRANTTSGGPHDVEWRWTLTLKRWRRRSVMRRRLWSCRWITNDERGSVTNRTNPWRLTTVA